MKYVRRIVYCLLLTAAANALPLVWLLYAEWSVSGVQPEKLKQDGGRGGHAEQPQQLTALRQPLDALGGAGLWNRTEIHP